MTTERWAHDRGLAMPARMVCWFAISLSAHALVLQSPMTPKIHPSSSLVVAETRHAQCLMRAEELPPETFAEYSRRSGDATISVAPPSAAPGPALVNDDYTAQRSNDLASSTAFDTAEKATMSTTAADYLSGTREVEPSQIYATSFSPPPMCEDPGARAAAMGAAMSSVEFGAESPMPGREKEYEEFKARAAVESVQDPYKAYEKMAAGERAGAPAYARPPVDTDRRSRSPGLQNNFYDMSTADFKRPHGMRGSPMPDPPAPTGGMGGMPGMGGGGGGGRPGKKMKPAKKRKGFGEL